MSLPVNRPAGVGHGVSAAATESIDVLSEVLHTTRLRGWVADEASFASPWRIRVSAGLAFYLVVRGNCCLELDDAAEPVNLAPGDFVLVVHGSSHSLREGLHHPAIPVQEFATPASFQQRRTADVESGAALAHLICGGFVLEERRNIPWLASLPRFIQVSAVDGQPAAWLAEILRLMIRESHVQWPGRQAIVNHLAQIILIQSIRSCGKALPAGEGNWLAAVTDSDIGPALGLMHSQPAWPWTVASLAQKTGMSRSAFAARFKALVAKPPQQYLVECRMRMACNLLRDGHYGIKEIATRVGYATRAAFSNAFRRWSGQTPASYRRHVAET